MIRCSPQDQRGQWPPTPVALGTIYLVPEQEHVNQTLPGVAGGDIVCQGIIIHSTVYVCTRIHWFNSSTTLVH